MHNYLKGVTKALCSLSLLLSVVSCSEGTDEEFVSAYTDSINMNIQPAYYMFGLYDTFDNAPDSMIVLFDRVIQSWRGAYVEAFDSTSIPYNYKGNGHYLNPMDSALTKSHYNILAFTYDTLSYNYNTVKKFLARVDGTSIFDVKLSYNTDFQGKVMEPSRILSSLSTMDNFNIYTPYSNSDVQVSLRTLTQRYEYTFYIYKTDSIACVDAVTVEVEGVPHSIDLRTGKVDASKTVTISKIANLSHQDSFKSGRDTVNVSFDAITVIHPNDKNKISNPIGARFGFLNVYLTIRNLEGKVKQHHVRYKMNDLNDFTDAYEIGEDSTTLYTLTKANEGKGALRWLKTIDYDILINRDTITSTSYGLWTVVK
ncbi:MAG: hypothetical protein K6E54_00450 [Bacteroidaceae bacterium]|nr:hypothetical protein [Bacteroidaceae bacterium]